MKNKALFAAFVSLYGLSLTGCGGRAESDRSPLLDFPDSMVMEWETLTAADEVVPFPTGMAVDDSSVCVAGRMDGHWFHRYKANDSLLQLCDSRIVEGSGNMGDIMVGACMSVTDSAISFFDGVTRQVKVYRAEDLEVVKSVKTSDYQRVVNGAWLLPGNRLMLEVPMMLPGLLGVPTYWVVDCDTAVELFAYRDIPQEFKECPEVMTASGDVAVSPDGTRFAYASVVGGTMVFFEIGDSAIRVVRADRAFPVDFVEKKGIKIPAKDSAIGFVALCADDSYLYGAYSGTPDYDDGRNIGVWDWCGNPVRLIRTDRRVWSMAVDSRTGHIYAVIASENGGYAIARIKI